MFSFRALFCATSVRIKTKVTLETAEKWKDVALIGLRRLVKNNLCLSVGAKGPVF